MAKVPNIRGMTSDNAYKALKAAGYPGLPDKSSGSAYGMVALAIREGAVIQVASKPRAAGGGGFAGKKPW